MRLMWRAEGEVCAGWCGLPVVGGPASRSSAQAVITQTLRDAVPERALQIAAVGGRRCCGWASGALSAVDRWLSGPASPSSAQAMIAQTLRDAVPERALQIAADLGRWCSPWASGVPWIIIRYPVAVSECCTGVLVVGQSSSMYFFVFFFLWALGPRRPRLGFGVLKDTFPIRWSLWASFYPCS